MFYRASTCLWLSGAPGCSHFGGGFVGDVPTSRPLTPIARNQTSLAQVASCCHPGRCSCLGVTGNQTWGNNQRSQGTNGAYRIRVHETDVSTRKKPWLFLQAFFVFFGGLLLLHVFSLHEQTKHAYWSPYTATIKLQPVLVRFHTVQWHYFQLKNSLRLGLSTRTMVWSKSTSAVTCGYPKLSNQASKKTLGHGKPKAKKKVFHVDALRDLVCNGCDVTSKNTSPKKEPSPQVHVQGHVLCWFCPTLLSGWWADGLAGGLCFCCFPPCLLPCFLPFIATFLSLICLYFPGVISLPPQKKHTHAWSVKM